jgi:Fanconi anemia group M protein
MDTSPSAPRLRVVVDDRETRHGLACAIAAWGREVEVGRLAVGDVAIGTRVVVERKTVADFVSSIADRRLPDQAYALRGCSARPLLVVEGDDPAAAERVDPQILRGALGSLLVGYGIPVLRTLSMRDTARWIAEIAVREERRLARLAAQEHAAPTARTPVEVLAAIPGVGPWRARKLVESLGSPGAVFRADERTLRGVPGVGRVVARRIRELDGGAGEVSDAPAPLRAGPPTHAIETAARIR